MNPQCPTCKKEMEKYDRFPLGEIQDYSGHRYAMANYAYRCLNKKM